MAFSAIAFIAPNYRDFKTYWLKAYEPGTTTPKSMALDSGGAVTVAKLQLNADGFLVSAGDALVIPYIEGPYDLWLFPTEAEADANDTINAERLADNINSLNLSLINDLSQAHEFPTVADYKAFTVAFPVGKIINLLDRGASFTIIAGTGTANTFNIIASTSTGQSASLIMDSSITAKSFGAVDSEVISSSGSILAYISALRKNPISILDTIGGDTITAYTSGNLYLGAGTFVVEPSVLDITQDIGLTFIGEGSRGKTNYQRGNTVLLIKGTSSSFGIRSYRNGGRNLSFVDMDVSYFDADFTGDLLETTDSPGFKLTRCAVGTYGITAGTRTQTARSLVRPTYDEFIVIDDCTFDGAVNGFYDDNTITEFGNTFGGSAATIKNCVFYDFTGDMIYSAATRTRQGLTLQGNVYNPISVSPERAVNIANVDELIDLGNKYAGSTTQSATTEWASQINCSGIIHGNGYGDLLAGTPSRMATFNGKLDIRSNVVFGSAVDGFLVTGGVITGGSNEFSDANSAWVFLPSESLSLALGPDEFKAAVTTSYFTPADSVNLSGSINYSRLLDNSGSSYSNVSDRVSIASEARRKLTQPTLTYTISKRETGEVILASGASAQTFTLPTLAGNLGSRYKILKFSVFGLTIVPNGADRIYFGGSGLASSVSATSTTSLGDYLELEATASGWIISSINGAWTWV